jgi:hypothetical protein
MSILKTAIVGTLNQQLDKHALPSQVKDALQQLPCADSEDELLKAAILENQYQLTGQMPQKYLGVLPQFIITSQEVYCNEDFAKIFKQIVDLDVKFKDSLILKWLHKLKEKNILVHKNYMGLVLNYFSNKSKRQKRLALHCCGVIGQKVVAFVPNFNVQETYENEELLWQHGKSEERYQLLSENDISIFELLQTTWLQETISFKKRCVSILSFQKYEQAVLIFFKEVLYKEFEYKPKEKVIETEVRNGVINYLGNFDKAFFDTTLWPILSNYFSIEKTSSLLGLRKSQKINIVIPVKEDAVININYLKEKFGITDKAYNPDIEKATYLFFELLMASSVVYIAEMLSVAVKELLAALHVSFESITKTKHKQEIFSNWLYAKMLYERKMDLIHESGLLLVPPKSPDFFQDVKLTATQYEVLANKANNYQMMHLYSCLPATELVSNGFAVNCIQKIYTEILFT